MTWSLIEPWIVRYTTNPHLLTFQHESQSDYGQFSQGEFDAIYLS
ncbi:MAG: hypothetical protein AB7T59_11710 [Hyphomonadaceae bacterium]